MPIINFIHHLNIVRIRTFVEKLRPIAPTDNIVRVRSHFLSKTERLKSHALIAIIEVRFCYGALMELRNEAFHLLRQLFQQHTARWQHALPELTKPQYAVMRAIAENPGIEQVALTEVAVSTKATLAEMLSRMEARGLVRREQDPADKRRRFLFLTAQGEAALSTSVPLGTGVDEEFLGRLSEAEREQFTILIRKMMR